MQPLERLTPPGAGGVAVIAVRGSVAQRRLAEAFSGAIPERAGIAYGQLLSGDRSIDEVLVCRDRRGALELHTHGSPAIVREVMERLGGGSPPADEVGPSGRALPVEDRAAAAVHGAPSELGARILLDQAGGALRRELEAFRGLAPEARAVGFAALAQRGRERARLFRRTTVVLAGPVNAGKSTLFNAIVGRDAAVVTDQPGTTRDALGEPARLGPWPVVVVDTAGERELDAELRAGDAAAAVEAEGQRFARLAAERAEVVLRLVPAVPGASGLPPGVLVTGAARIFGPDAARWPSGAISALEDPGHARRVVTARFEGALGLPSAGGARASAGGARAAPLWERGQGVPFAPDLVQRCQELGAAGRVSEAALDAALLDL